MIGKKVPWCVCLLLITVVASAQPGKHEWVDSVFKTLNENEKVGQLFVARISSHADNDLIRSLEKKIESGDYGGLIFTSGSPEKQARITTRLQADVQVPLLIAQDASSGLGHLLDSTLAFPPPLAQGAIINDSLIYWMGRDIGRQLKALGVHMSLSPNATPVHSETTDPGKLYGRDPLAVARKSMLHMKGLQEEGILSCAKYFPLKSIEVIDQKGKSHITLYHDTLVSYPYQRLFAGGLNAVVPDPSDLHFFFEPKLSDLRDKLSDASFQQFETGDLLHKPIGFDGIVMLDLRGMHTSEKFLPGDAGLFAFQAGADLIISDEDPDPAVRKIRKLLHTEDKYASMLDQRVRKVLSLKYDAGLSGKKDIDKNLKATLHATESQVLRRKLLSETITVVRNDNRMLPVRILENKQFMCLIAGDSTERAGIFHRSVKKYIPAERIVVRDGVQNVDVSKADVILVALFPATSKETMQNIMGILQELAAHQEVIVADFGCGVFKAFADRFPAVVTGHTDDRDIVGMVPQVIFGGMRATGVLPVAFGAIAAGTPIKTDHLQRLAYSFPEDAGVDGATLGRISEIANEAIGSGSTPGCYVLIAKGGKVIYDNAFGHLTYEQRAPVTDETLYDLASLTKVSATLQAVMFMHEHGLIDIQKKLSVYLPELKGTNKKDITIIDVLTHQAGLAPFIPLWPLTLEGPALKPMYYSSQQNVSYPLQIAPTLFGSPVLKDSVWSWITF